MSCLLASGDKAKRIEMLKATDRQIYQRLQGLPGWLALALVVLGLLLGLFTFLTVAGLTPIKLTEDIFRKLLLMNGVIALFMLLIVIVPIIQLFIARSKGTPGSGLHIRMISLFSIVAVVPALLVASFAAVTFNRALDAGFSDRTSAIVNTAANVAEAYLQNAAEATRIDLANISADLAQQTTLYRDDRPAFVNRVARHADLRNLAAVFVFNAENKSIDANVVANDRIKFVAPSEDMMKKATAGEAVVIAPSKDGNVVRALVKIQNFRTHYLYIYRILSPVVLDQLVKTREAKREYDEMLKYRLGYQLTYASAFGLLALVFLLASIWMGLRFSDRLVEPLIRLLAAARRVAQGDFNAKVATLQGPGDLVRLSQTFNMMTDQVRHHRDQLVHTNEQLDDRRRFTEAMLAGVSAGVIGVDPDLKISIVNRSALNLLGLPETQIFGRGLRDAVPQFASLFELAMSRPSGSAEGHVEMLVEGREVNLFVRITTERSDDAEHGYVLTFDDITNLVSAQRNSAWADIARRIAHEIKNPLTPIQLSAERLKRKYLNEIKTDRKVFEQCTDTIIRQVGDIGRIVDEFSSFARMPKAVPELNDLAEVVRDATVLQRVSSSDIDIDLAEIDAVAAFAFDRRLITQAITNLVKNARESVETRIANDPGTRGKITVESGSVGQTPYVRIVDNGIGLPQENRHRLTEPYMTTREKGTGLGLAIVKRIMEEHGGSLQLADVPDGSGAAMTLWFAASVLNSAPPQTLPKKEMTS